MRSYFAVFMLRDGSWEEVGLTRERSSIVANILKNQLVRKYPETSFKVLRVQ